MADGDRYRSVVDRLQGAGIPVSWFIDADSAQIEAAAQTGAQFIELHTGTYANAEGEAARAGELAILTEGAILAHRLGLRVNAGHGLTYQNVYPVATIPHMEELNIGHTIISRAALVGMERAVQDMKKAMRGKL